MIFFVCPAANCHSLKFAPWSHMLMTLCRKDNAKYFRWLTSSCRIFLASISSGVGAARLRFVTKKMPSAFSLDPAYFSFGTNCKVVLWLADGCWRLRFRRFLLLRLWLAAGALISWNRAIQTGKYAKVSDVCVTNTQPTPKFFSWLGPNTFKCVVRALFFRYLVFLKQKNRPIKINYFFLIKKSIFYYHCRI